ncbi:MAG: QueT transporter family protein [Clostridiales bacterium]|nr:QueT transporter family protein [Clostridiales bacterium]
MDMKNMSKTQKLTLSGTVMAVYIVVMYFTQSFAFGQYQVRIATAIYSTAYLFPFLVVPLGLSNLLSNMLMGGFGFFDIFGGGLVGILTAGCCALLGRSRCSTWLVALPIALIPAFGVSLYLSGLLGVSYWALALSLLVGQIVCGVAGGAFLKALYHVWKPSNRKEKSNA